jgi:hypothetical protein
MKRSVLVAVCVAATLVAHGGTHAFEVITPSAPAICDFAVVSACQFRGNISTSLSGANGINTFKDFYNDQDPEPTGQITLLSGVGGHVQGGDLGPSKKSGTYTFADGTKFNMYAVKAGNSFWMYRLTEAVSSVSWNTANLDNKDASHLSFYTASFSNAPIPEPGTWALMIGGFGLVGAALRRRALVAA